MKITIRKAEKEDMPSVLELIKELAAFEKEPEAVAISEETLMTEGFGENPSFTCFVAEISTEFMQSEVEVLSRKSEIVGMALIYFRFSTWKGKTIHLEDLIVKESKRGLGIGKLLYTEVMKFAQSKGVKRVEWVVLDWNKNAIAFYEKTGAKLLKDWYLAQMDADGLAKYLKFEDC